MWVKATWGSDDAWVRSDKIVTLVSDRDGKWVATVEGDNSHYIVTCKQKEAIIAGPYRVPDPVLTPDGQTT